MKKAIVLLFGLLLCLSSFVFASEINVDSRLQEVTVYLDSALISRIANIKLNPGEHSIIFSDIIPEVDENSLRVSLTDTLNVKISGAQVKKEFLKEEASERVQQLKDEIQKLEDEVKRLGNTRKILSEEKDFLDSLRIFSKDQIPKDLVTKMPSAQDLDNTYKFLDTKLRENFAQIMDIELKIRETQEKIDVLKRELAQISGPQKKLKRSITVDLEVLKSANFDLKISYLVRGASWYPIYDARANFEKNKVELISYAIAKQTTGEDWQDVEISLSTAKPAIGGRMPYVNPWFLRPYQPRFMEKRARALGASAYQMEAFKSDMAPGEKAEPEVQYALVEEKGTAVVYKLARKATVKSDGSEHKLLVSSQDLIAKFEYSTYPRAILSAYLGSRVTNAPNLQLLAGRVNIFLEGDFVGTSGIDNIGPGEEFDLYLGADENVKVKREQLEKKVDETLIAGIPSPTKRTIFKYKLTVENYKSKKISMKLFESMPVSQEERIKVKIEKISLEPKEKDWEDRKGVWLWKLELEAKQKQEIFYTLVVEHPRDMQVEGL